MTVRRATIVLLVMGVALIPWTIILAIKLPAKHIAHHYDVAWVGFDLMLATMVVMTAVALMRRWPAARSLAAGAGALLLADAWFDVVTASTGNERVFALVLAVLVELPLATMCFVLARPEDEDRIDA